MGLPTLPHDLSVYVHIPFCVRKCSYCDFNAYADMAGLADAYVDALRTEVGRGLSPGRRAATVFFGGGTPTYLPPEQLAMILDAVRARYSLAEHAEITAEANPTTVDAGRFAAMRQAGFNRISIGVQAFDDRLLRWADRDHSAREAEEAVASARSAGFANVSIDLICGLPTQTRADWDAALQRAVALSTEHVSVYALTLEPGTRFERLHAGGKLPLPTEDDELWMFERAIAVLTSAGFEHYEISNFARPGCRARHNLTYWRNEEYAGFGAGAASYLEGRRWTNERLPSRYIARVRDGAELAVESERLDVEAAVAETLMLGLRLREGVELARVQRRYGVDPRARYGALFARLADAGLLKDEAGSVRLTHNGLLMANDVFVQLLPG